MQHPERTHQITPFLDLVKQWSDDWHNAKDNDFDLVLYVALQATRWGAAQELDACCEWISEKNRSNHPFSSHELRAARRPEPPSLKEQALDQLRSIQIDLTRCGMGISVDTIRRALEQLDD